MFPTQIQFLFNRHQTINDNTSNRESMKKDLSLIPSLQPQEREAEVLQAFRESTPDRIIGIVRAQIARTKLSLLEEIENELPKRINDDGFDFAIEKFLHILAAKKSHLEK
jgi:hypothetical protein